MASDYKNNRINKNCGTRITTTNIRMNMKCGYGMTHLEGVLAPCHYSFPKLSFFNEAISSLENQPTHPATSSMNELWPTIEKL